MPAEKLKGEGGTVKAITERVSPRVFRVVARSDDKKRARLNIITHLLGRIPYKSAPRPKIKLPKRQKPHGYREPRYPYKYVDEAY